MTIRIYDTDRSAAAALADQVSAALEDDPYLVLGLPTGRTPLPFYERLVADHTTNGADFSRATTFNLDEFVGLDPGHPGSYRAYMERHLFAHVNISRSRTHFLNGCAPDLEAECARYEEAIDRAGGIGLQILGIGSNGHIGFNEPGPTLAARCHRVKLRAETRRANAIFFDGDPTRVPTEALSMGMGTILKARSIILLATGLGKASAVARMVQGPLTTRLPASFLQTHRDVEVYLDRAAASRLTRDREPAAGTVIKV